jgi:hypothetical protein
LSNKWAVQSPILFDKLGMIVQIFEHLLDNALQFFDRLPGHERDE